MQFNLQIHLHQTSGKFSWLNAKLVYFSDEGLDEPYIG